MIVRGGEHHLWSRGEDLMTDRFPELARLRDYLPDGTVIDGEVLAFAGERPLSFNALQKRIGRKTVPKRLLAEAPVILLIWNNDGYGEIRTYMQTNQIKTEGVDLSPIDFSALAKGFGADYAEAADIPGVISAAKGAIGGNRPLVIEVKEHAWVS